MQAIQSQAVSLSFLNIRNFITEQGQAVNQQELSYQVFGQALGSAPTVLVIHALTGNSTVAGETGWWNYLIGDGLAIDTRYYSVLAFDIPGNGYSGRPESILEVYDMYSARDIARLFGLALGQLGIQKLHAILGGSLGGGIAWELAVLYPNLADHLFPVAADWKATDWIIAHNRVQKEILEHGARPLETARMMAMLFYRSSPSFTAKFKRQRHELPHAFEVESWLLHHGDKLKNRFQIQAYKTMNHLLTTVDITRGRGSLPEAVQYVKAQVHQIGIDSDLFFDPTENKNTAALLQEHGFPITYNEISSIHGHDAFLIEFDQMTPLFQNWFPIPKTPGNAKSDTGIAHSSRPIKQVNLALFGPGSVGTTLLRQIRESGQKILRRQGIQLNVIAIANSKKLVLSEQNLAENWNATSIEQGISYDLEDLLQYVRDQKPGNLIAIDATSGDKLARRYPELIQAGFHLVSANKNANAFEQATYNQLRQLLRETDRQFRYETNVGAGLPLISTIRELHNSGENIRKIRGVFSGSLSYIFNRFGRKDLTFSEILEEARQFGLTEPDPREDLNGLDVARKLLILARELQLEIELDDIQVKGLIPAALLHTRELNAFLSQKTILDAHFQQLKSGLSANEVLRYVGEIDVRKNKFEVSLQAVSLDSSLGQVRGADSIFEIYSESYRQPLVIQGAGAGLEVTARGLLSDVLKIAEY
ncbi:MAG: alpha/beta fold hydrolase [Saprospiraceae bacterium]|nr:alpha/beta fold hydrolase [Saprospiraceae bacterium]